MCVPVRTEVCANRVVKGRNNDRHLLLARRLPKQMGTRAMLLARMSAIERVCAHETVATYGRAAGKPGRRLWQMARFAYVWKEWKT